MPKKSRSYNIPHIKKQKAQNNNDNSQQQNSIHNQYTSVNNKQNNQTQINSLPLDAQYIKYRVASQQMDQLLLESSKEKSQKNTVTVDLTWLMSGQMNELNQYELQERIQYYKVDCQNKFNILRQQDSELTVVGPRNAFQNQEEE
ncbi:Hypothetical_protein [Hexamita inflata]|uniref:Hypothetical_protein n=1 Tax=Hexamita inflata TaxID=28002 RepID=A0AA86QH62_9EUKA|nr:Hypothetical protein HINF_LOCUS40689 [Hexamita inflata]